MIYTLKNPIKNFPWGSRTAIRDYFGIDNPNSEHQAELWMGAHPLASSSIQYYDEDVLLCDVIAQNPEYWLGKQITTSSPAFPFLVKILAAEEPLSIQVHPSKPAAEIGFAAENEQGMPLDAPYRNYKDANHKPELVYALTPYLAMNGFREYNQILANFDALELPTLKALCQPFKKNPNPLTLANFFSAILSLSGALKIQAINELLNSSNTIDKSHFLYEASSLISRFYQLYPEDIGLFAPLFLNIIELQPGEAMFLCAETPHAYVRGLGIEVMANSDNVLRAGLTPKYIDLKELVSNTKFEPIKYADLKFEGEFSCGREIFNVPVDDFSVDVFKNTKEFIEVLSPEVILCIEGKVCFSYGTNILEIEKGESVIIPAYMMKYQIDCAGTAMRVYC
ncbi:mannose-6-phosphate isomerase, class I [Vibrio cyclitrophicus]